ncbi:MAG: DUF2442 domain-containing protein [Synechocystis sp.]|jgi:hypothetical protein
MDNSSVKEHAFANAFAKAQVAAQLANLTEPRAVSAYYDHTKHLISIQLLSGASFTFPPDIAQGLAGAKPEELEQVEVTPMGDGLHWEILDADLSVPHLLQGIFGSPQWMTNLRHQWRAQMSQ